MPNHYTTRVTVSGPQDDLAKFKAKHIVLGNFEDEPDAMRFDFKTIIPMPKEIEGTVSGSVVDDGLAILGREDVRTKSNPMRRTESLKDMLEWAWVKQASITTTDELKQKLLERNPDCVEQAELHLKVFDATGYLNWYDWSIANWGTKWNSYAFQIIAETPKSLCFSFDTAWAPPTPVLEKVREMYPTLRFKFVGHDEDERGWQLVA